MWAKTAVPERRARVGRVAGATATEFGTSAHESAPVRARALKSHRKR